VEDLSQKLDKLTHELKDKDMYFEREKADMLSQLEKLKGND